MHNGHMALQTCQNVKKNLPIPFWKENIQSRITDTNIPHENTTGADDTPNNPKQLHGGGVVSEAVGVAHRRAGGSSPPLLETSAEDEDADRKEEESEGEPEGGEDDGAPAMEEAESIQR